MRSIEEAPKVGRLIVDTIARRPLLVLVLALAGLFALTPGLKKITTDFTHTGFFFEDDPLLKEFEAFERQFGNDDSLVIALNSPSGIFDPDSAKLILEVTEKMWLMPDIIRVTSLSNYSWVHAEEDDILVDPFLPDDEELTQELLDQRKSIALSHEVIPDYLVSTNTNTALFYARVKPGIKESVEAQPIVQAARDLTAGLKRTDHTFYISGGPAITTGFQEATQADLQRLIPVVLGLIIVSLLFALKSPLGVLLSLLVVILTIIAAMSVTGWTGFPITSVTGILPQILIAIGVADAVHILTVFRQARRAGHSKSEAAHYTLLKNFLPTLLTSVSTTIGFLSFSTANLKSLAGLGILAGCGVMIAWYVSYFILGPLLFMLPSRIKEAQAASQKSTHRRAKQFTDKLAAYRRPILISFGAICVVSAFLALKTDVNSDPYQYFRPGLPLRDANDFITQEVGGARGIEIVVKTGREDGVKDPAFLKKLEGFQSWLDDMPQVTRTLSILDILKATNRSLHGDDQAYYRLPDTKELVGQELFLYTMSLPQGMDINDQLSVKNDSLRLRVLWTISASRQWIEQREVIAQKAKEMGLDITLTGKGNLYQSMNPYVVESFVRSISVALILISILLITVFGSVKLGLAALIPNCIPLIMGGALFYLIDKPLDAGSVLVMSVCLGIAVDDTIHILTNFNRLRAEGLNTRDATTEVLAHTSPALIFTTLILVSGFGTLAFATFVPNIYFGIMTAVILSIALITDLTFLLALLDKPQGAD